jgi:hypothetical protein
MNSRSARSTVTFTKAFRLHDDDELPAGDYEVLVEEERLEGLSFDAYRRTGTYLLVNTRSGGSRVSEMRPVDPADLDAALLRDRSDPGPDGTGAGATPPFEERP